MRQAPLDRGTFETIEAYVRGRMQPADRIAFEGRLERDPDLREEVELQRDSIHAIELGGFMRSIKGIVLEEKSGTAGRSWYRWIGYAASVAIIVTVTIWWGLRPPMHERLFADHFRPDPGLPVEMGLTDDPAFSDAMVYYKEGAYEEAIARWKPLLDAAPANDTLLFYTGISSLASDHPEAAIGLLRSVTYNSSSVFRDRAQWYLFLAYVRIGDIDAARARLQAVPPENAAEAQAILNELD